MANLIEKSPCDELRPITEGFVKLAVLPPGKITSIAPAKGKVSLVSAALKAATKLTFPAPNRTSGTSGTDAVRLIWMAPDQAFLIGAAVVPLKNAAITDQSDGWTILRLQGRDAEAVLARLIPIDLRASVFKRGHTARTLLFHMSISITRTAADCFDIMVFRSMTRTAFEELHVAMKSVAAQK